MKTDNSYISNKLCHFVGHAEKDYENQYQILKLILNSQYITKKPDDPKGLYQYAQVDELQINENGDLFDTLDCVCFCDIPDDSLKIHISKYGVFGLALSNDYLVAKGAKPVIYIPRKGKTNLILGTSFKQICTNKSFASLADDAAWSASIFKQLASDPELIELIKKYVLEEYDRKKIATKRTLTFRDLKTYTLYRFFTCSNYKQLYNKVAATSNLLGQFLPFIKFYDHKLADKDANNFYYEREWRINCSVDFTLDNVVTIYLPSSYVKRFVNDFPSYSGGFYMLDE